MSKVLFVENAITIDAPAASVWDLLTNPAHTPKYMFGCTAESDWQPGSPLLWNGEWEGQAMTFVKGNIVTIEPDKLLVYTAFDPNSGNPDIPENYTTVTYRLTAEGGATALFVSQGDYATVPDGPQKHAEAIAAGGWQSILEQIKTLAEAG